MPLLIRRIAHGSAGYAAAVNLRRTVLRKPLGLDFTSAQLAAEAGEIHLAAFDGEDVVGSVSLAPYDDTTLKLRQMAVDEDVQGKGLGAKLLAAAEDQTREQGKTRITLAARVVAQNFYAKNGYAVFGDVFEEVGIPHVIMRKSL